jgi:hypothetical protein
LLKQRSARAQVLFLSTKDVCLSLIFKLSDHHSDPVEQIDETITISAMRAGTAPPHHLYRCPNALVALAT